MDLPHSNRPRRLRKPTPSSDRFLRISPLQNPNSSSSSSSNADELSEDVVVFMNNDDSEPIPSSSSSTSSTPRHHLLPSTSLKPFSSTDSFGILAALPENEPSPNAQNSSHLFRKASVSSTSSSSSRSIPAIPKPPLERIPSYSSMASSVKYPQSAPVNVPVMSPAMMKERRKHRDFDEDVDDDDDEGEEMLPPHVHMARKYAQSPVLASSVLEGVGRTLKGRDLRQVRNAVWRQTGFLD